jgi:cysteine desulfurase
VKLPIYLDCNATTPVDRRVFEAMAPYFMEVFGNAASTGHAFGAAALAAVTRARETIAAHLHVEPDEIVFTSGATESDNLAIKGVARLHGGGHVITGVTEHKAVLDPCQSLVREGFRVTCLPVDREGFVSVDAVREAIAPDTILVSIMHGNNEVGTIQDIAAIGALCRERGVVFHTDATQTIGKLPFDAQTLQVDLASLTAHKMYGPKGIGALYVRRTCRLAPILDGGGHEGGLRSGTLNVPGIVGLASALDVAVSDMAADLAHTRGLRDRLWIALRDAAREARLNGPDPLTDSERRLPNNLHVSIPGLAGDVVAAALCDVALSSRSACTSAASGPSHVVTALHGCVEGCTTLRLGVGRCTTAAEIDYVVDRLASVGASIT